MKLFTNPGGWGSKNKITTLKELREDMAVLDAWKKANAQRVPSLVQV